jgi:hypothetical protein
VTQAAGQKRVQMMSRCAKCRNAVLKVLPPKLWLSDNWSSLPLSFAKVFLGSRMPLYMQSKDFWLKIKKMVFYTYKGFLNADIFLFFRTRESGRFQRVLTVVYDSQSYWVFGLHALSSILKTRKHNISKTGSVSILR